MQKALAAFAATAVCVFAVATVAVAQSSSKDKKPSKPTGACTITVYGVSPACTSPMTRASCNAVAKKVGGVASWQEGKSCPPK